MTEQKQQRQWLLAILILLVIVARMGFLAFFDAIRCSSDCPVYLVSDVPQETEPA